MSFYKLSVHLIAPTLFLLGMQQFAVAAEGRGPEGSIAAQRMLAGTSRIRVEGRLSCTVAGENTGEACALKIEDKRTGRTLSLVGDKGAAMKLFHSGTTQVAVEGYAGDNGSLDVRLAQAL